MRHLAATLVFLALAVPAARAHHRQTPPIVAITTSGEASLPRLPPPGKRAVAVVHDGGVRVSEPLRKPTAPSSISFAFTQGTNANPSISSSGRAVAWDSDADPFETGAPGRQMISRNKITIDAPGIDPTGTSANAAIDATGAVFAFESTGDLAATGNAGARQIFFGPLVGGPLMQISHGVGTSRHPAVGRRGRTIAYDSTSHPATGDDTGIPQIYIANALTGTRERITDGLGASERPSLPKDARLVVFESRADLAGDGHDTGTPQIFLYDTFSKTFARLTNEPGGCTGPSTVRIKRDWRVAYVCSGAAYFTMIRANQRFQVATDGGDTTGILPQPDVHFMLVATTANLAGSGTTSGHRVYMVNLFTRPAIPVSGSITWFPFQGIPALK